MDHGEQRPGLGVHVPVGLSENALDMNPTVVAIGMGDVAQFDQMRGFFDSQREALEAAGPPVATEYSATMERVEMMVAHESCKRVRSGNRGGSDYDFIRRAGGYEDERIVDTAADGREVFRCARCFARSGEPVDPTSFVALNPILKETFSDPNHQYDSFQCVYSLACEVVGLQRTDMHATFLDQLEDLYHHDAQAFRYTPAPNPYTAVAEIALEACDGDAEILHHVLPISAWDPDALARLAAAEQVGRVPSAEQVEYQAFHQQELDESQAAAVAYEQQLHAEMLIQQQQQQLFEYHATENLYGVVPDTQHF